MLKHTYFSVNINQIYSDRSIVWLHNRVTWRNGICLDTFKERLRGSRPDFSGTLPFGNMIIINYFENGNDFSYFQAPTLFYSIKGQGRPRNIKGGGGGIALPQLQNDFKGGFPVLTRSSSQLAARSFVRGLEIRLYAPARGSEIWDTES